MASKITISGTHYDGIKKALDDLNTILAGPTFDYIYFESDTYTFRLGCRSDVLYLDQTMTATGFDGAENTDWANITSFKLA